MTSPKTRRKHSRKRRKKVKNLVQRRSKSRVRYRKRRSRRKFRYDDDAALIYAESEVTRLKTAVTAAEAANREFKTQFTRGNLSIQRRALIAAKNQLKNAKRRF